MMLPNCPREHRLSRRPVTPWLRDGGNSMQADQARGKVDHTATIVIAMNSDKKVNGEQGINVLLRDISKILFPNNPVNVPVIK